MANYNVALKFYIRADTPREAAEKAQILARDEEHFWSYEVISDDDKKEVSCVDLDLDE